MGHTKAVVDLKLGDFTVYRHDDRVWQKEDGPPALCYIAGYYKARVQVELMIHPTPKISLFIYSLVAWSQKS